jgi:hypothetical protein
MAAVAARPRVSGSSMATSLPLGDERMPFLKHPAGLANPHSHPEEDLVLAASIGSVRSRRLLRPRASVTTYVNSA